MVVHPLPSTATLGVFEQRKYGFRSKRDFLILDEIHGPAELRVSDSMKRIGEFLIRKKINPISGRLLPFPDPFPAKAALPVVDEQRFGGLVRRAF